MAKEDIIASLKQHVAAFERGAKEVNVGTVISIGDGIARLSGLSNVMASEMLEFPGGVMGARFSSVLGIRDRRHGSRIGSSAFGEGKKKKVGNR